MDESQRAQVRWAGVLDRIEHRQADVGLRFWDPPLWLEVTMTGPDSDRWPAVGQPTAWDWQSNTLCTEATKLADEDAEEDLILSVIGRYTIENLILNAVHEIGEWLRVDGHRLFPPHLSTAGARAQDQGNGAVLLQMHFGHDACRTAGFDPDSVDDEHLALVVPGWGQDATVQSRYTYLPGTTISCEASGPTIRRWSTDNPTASSRSSWSASTLEAARSRNADLPALVGRDVHRMLVMHEADRICRAFHIDGRRPWRIVPTGPDVDPGRSKRDPQPAEPLAISILYAAAGQVRPAISPAAAHRSGRLIERPRPSLAGS